MNTASRASSTTNASSYLVKSKHDAKYRRVPRIISRRLYCYRRKICESRSPSGVSSSGTSRPSEITDFSPRVTDFSTFGETILKFLVKYPHRRSYSTDSDPLVQLRTEMNKTAYFNHNLMKRRYSVPETIMRKHKLQELLSKKAAASVESKPPSVVKDESCQTDDTNLDRRKKTSKRKRDGLRYFKKSNTYCQYKSYLHKKKYHRETKSGTSATEESTCTSSPLDCHSISSTSLPILVDPKKCSESKSSVSRQVSAPSSSEEFEKLVIKSSETKKSTTSLHPLRQSSLRQLSAPESEDFCKHDHQSSNNKVLHPIRQSSAPSSSDEKHPSRLKVSSDKLFDSSKRVHIKNCKSIDQNTSGYNTICGSLDEYTTPRKKTPENTKISTIEEHHHHQDDRKNKNMYPITFHSESVFLHPCQQGIISHKQFHQISIQMTPEDGHQKQKTEPEPKNDYFKTEIKLNVNDSNNQDTKVQSQSAECCVKDKPSPATTPRPSETPKQAPTRCTTPTVQIIEEAPTPRPEVANEDEPYDCSVPDNYPIKGSENKSNLKIEVDVGNVDIPTNLHDILLRHQKPSTELEAAPLKPKQEGNKYNSKAALNYLFQKLGDSYPRRYLLKQPVFEYKPQFGRYYSELPKPERTEIPSKVLFNNQTYNILSGNLLPNEWSNVNPTLESEHLSDSDISIADSLEDFQQHHHHHQHQTTKYHNKYNKYDEKLARGDVPAKPSVKPSKNKGVAYFIPLLDSNKTKPIMPAELRKKLCQRNDTLSKHSLCSEPASPVSSKKSPRNKFIHKQIQTCLNSDDSLKKRRKKFADGNLQKNSESQTELDEKIKNILLSGVEDSSPVKENQQRSLQQTFNQSVQTESAEEPVISEYMEMFNVSSPATNSNNNSEFFNNDRLYEIILSEEEVGRVNSNNFYRSFKKCRRIYYPNNISEQRPVQDETRSSHSNSNIPTFSAYQKKLKEFKKQNTPDKLPPPQNHSRVSEMSLELLPLPYPRMKKSREKPKIASKIPGPKRYYQKFEAIPEELSNSSDGGAPLDLQLSGNSDENNESMPGQGSDDDIGQVDENKNLVDEEPVTLDLKQMNNFDRVVNGVDDEKDGNDRGDVMTEQSGMELKSQKGRDSLLVSNEHEELITLSKGWINFYLLKGASTEENSAPEDVEDDSVAHSETIQIPQQRPQQYTIHVHATPELLPPPNPNGITSSLPGLCNSSTKKLQKYEKFNQICPSLPDIPNVSSNQVVTTTNPIQLTENSNSSLMPNQTNQLVVIHRPDAAKQENSISTVTTSSNYSESPCEELPGRNVKKFQRYQRPHTYHSTRTTRNQWSLTLKGSNDDKRVNDIEMQLSLKNNPNQYLPSNQSWKLTLKSENTETSQLTRSSRQTVNRGYLPHLNVNYKMLPSPNYQEKNITANYSETNSGSNSTLSYGSRKYKLDSELLLQNVTSLNNDLTVQIRHSDDDLTIRGSAITPERKPRVPTMSERDLTRMRLIRQTSADTRLL